MEVTRYPTSVLAPNSAAMEALAPLGADEAKVLETERPLSLLFEEAKVEGTLTR